MKNVACNIARNDEFNINKWSSSHKPFDWQGYNTYVGKVKNTAATCTVMHVCKYASIYTHHPHRKTHYTLEDIHMCTQRYAAYKCLHLDTHFGHSLYTLHSKEIIHEMKAKKYYKHHGLW